MELSGKVAVITGASMGIGEAIAKLFANQGAQVVMLSRDAVRAEAARGRIGHPEQTLALACDVRHREEIDRVVGLTMHHFKRIDIWVNNAGHGLLDSIASVKMSDFRELFETNLFGTVDGMQAVIPIMKQRMRCEAASRYGCVRKRREESAWSGWRGRFCEVYRNRRGK